MCKCKYCGETDVNKLVKHCRIKSGYRNICKQCHNQNEKNRRDQLSINKKQKQNKINWIRRKEKIENFSLDEKIVEWARRFINRSTIDLKNSKWAHTRKNLSIDFLVQQAKLALQKFPYMCFLEYGNKKWATASVDRIDSNLGYDINNVRIVPFWLNSAMLNMSDEDFKKVIEHYYNSFIKSN